MSDEEYWFSAESCYSCGGELKLETRKDRIVQVCKKCGAPTASIPRVIEK